MKRKKKVKLEQSKENNQIELTNMELSIIVTSPSYKELVGSKDLSAKAKFKLGKIGLRIMAAYKLFAAVKEESVEKYCKRDKEGKPVLKPPEIAEVKGVSAKDRQKTIDAIPKEQWLYDFDKKNEEIADKELKGLLEEPADIQGEKITLRPDDLPDGLLNSLQIGFLSRIINFEE